MQILSPQMFDTFVHLKEQTEVKEVEQRRLTPELHASFRAGALCSQARASKFWKNTLHSLRRSPWFSCGHDAPMSLLAPLKSHRHLGATLKRTLA